MFLLTVAWCIFVVLIPAVVAYVHIASIAPPLGMVVLALTVGAVRLVTQLCLL